MNNPFDDMSKPESNPYHPSLEQQATDMVMSTKQEQSWAMVIHLSGLVATLLGVSLLGFLGPLILWLLKREESEFLDHQGKEAVNFHLTMDIWVVAAGAITGATCGMAFPLLFVPFVMQVVFSIVAAVKVNDGQRYTYPLTLRFF